MLKISSKYPKLLIILQINILKNHARNKHIKTRKASLLILTINLRKLKTDRF